MRMELVLLGLFTVCWAVVVVLSLVELPVDGGVLDLDLYRYFGLAAFAGWLSGNVYVHRARALAASRSGSGDRAPGRRLLLVYLLGPLGLVYLLRLLAPAASQAVAPLAPIYASVVYAIFFLVPVSFRRPRRR